ncbi:MAG: ATP-binding protein [Candidatus Poseidonia sp.]|nr:ATP-binding protein [Poseidonia sp.]MEE2647224.1 ATP-binding protein [Candidatus Thermoplasmatota archaeon]
MGSSDDRVSPPSSTGDEASETSGVGGLIEDLFNDNVAAVSDSALSEGKAKKRHYKPKGMLLGTRRDTGDAIDIAPQVLARHGAMLGSTGSGKTVMAKALIEEAALAGIPSLIIDPQGDLARLALGIDLGELEEKNGLVNRAKKLLETCEVRIWTPLRSKGLPLCIDPFRAPPADLDAEEAITAWDMVAAGFANLAGYDVEKTQGKTVKPFLYEILVEGTRCGLDVGDFQALARVVREPHQEFIRHLYPDCFTEDEEDRMDPPTWNEVMLEHRLTDFEERLPKTTRNDLARRLAAFSSGVNQLLFSNGVPIDIDAFVEPAVPGKIPLNIVYLNTIQDENQKQYFVQELSRELYDWMLTQQPADGELKLLFFMDEVAPYLPPHPRNPPAKDLIKLIFKQARKYGVACVLATQNVSDVDYKILAQANTTFIGRFTQPQDVEKVRHLLKESGGDQDLVAQLPTLGPGQFQMVAPDVDPNPVPIQCRWLYTDHGAPLNEDQVEDIITPEIRAWARTRSAQGGRSRGAGAAHAASRGSSWSGGDAWEEGAAQGIVEAARIKSAGGMAAAAHGIVDDSAFEVKLMGGLAVLRDGRDPLYTMQAAVNLATVAVLTWVMGALMLAWRDADLSGWWLLVSATTCLAAVGVLVLEWVLGHDAELLQKLSRFAHTFQMLQVAWLWILLGWTVWGSLNLRGAEPFLEVVVVWVTMFSAIEYLTRFQLGRIRWNGGSALDKIVGVSALLTKAELTEMKATSRELLSAVRWMVHGATLVWLSSLLAFQGGVLPGDSSVSTWGRPTLWLASVYGLMFCSEAWLRLRGRWPNEHV